MNRYLSWHPKTRGNGYHCLLSYLKQQWFLHVPPFSLAGWILVAIYRNKTNAVIVVPDWLTHTGTCSCYRWPTRTCYIFGYHEEIWHCHIKPPSTTCYEKKTVVNSNQSNYTTENYLHIASIIIILNNGYLILKIYVMY